MSAVRPWAGTMMGDRPSRQGLIGGRMVKTYQAALWMAGWLVTTLGMTVAGRELATVLPVFMVMIMRSGIALCLLSPVVFLWYRGDPVRTRRLPWHLARNLVHFAGQYCWFLALALI